MEDTLRSGAFRAEVAAVLAVWRPDLVLIMPDDPDTIVVDAPTAEIQIFLGNLHANIRAFTGDARRDAILDFLINAISGSIPDRAEPAWPEAKGRLWIQIVPVVYASQNPTLVTRPFTSRVMIAYALVSDDTYKLVTQDMVERWGVAAEAVHDAAVAGLEAASKTLPITVKDAPGRGPGAYVILATGDNFDAARLVLPDFMARLRAVLGGTVTVGIPIRDVLIAWTPDCAARAQLMALIDENSQAGVHSHPLTNELFVATAAGVRPATEAGAAAQRGG
jgi:hypothetical protein